MQEVLRSAFQHFHGTPRGRHDFGYASAIAMSSATIMLGATQKCGTQCVRTRFAETPLPDLEGVGPQHNALVDGCILADAAHVMVSAVQPISIRALQIC